MLEQCLIRSSPACARRAACSPRTRRGCCGAAAETPDELEDLAARRAEGAPLEALLGWAEFCGLRIAVDPGRVRAPAADGVPGRAGRAPRPIGCGGRRPLLRHRRGGRCRGRGRRGRRGARRRRRPRRRRLRPPQPAARVYQGDLYAAAARRLRGRVDLLVVNAPYVPDRRDRDHAARGPRPRAPCRARRRRRRPRRPTPGRRGRPRLAAARRRAPDRDRRGPGAAHRRRVRRRGSHPARRPRRGRDGRDR